MREYRSVYAFKPSKLYQYVRKVEVSQEGCDKAHPSWSRSEDGPLATCCGSRKGVFVGSQSRTSGFQKQSAPFFHRNQRNRSALLCPTSCIHEHPNAFYRAVRRGNSLRWHEKMALDCFVEQRKMISVVTKRPGYPAFTGHLENSQQKVRRSDNHSARLHLLGDGDASLQRPLSI